MHYTPGLKLKVSEEVELLGIDEADMGELAYDYVALEPEIGTFVHDDMAAVEQANRPYHESESGRAHFELKELGLV